MEFFRSTIEPVEKALKVICLKLNRNIIRI
jgi:hypothetical protein